MPSNPSPGQAEAGPAAAPVLLRQLNLLEGPGTPARRGAALLDGCRLLALDQEAEQQAEVNGWPSLDASALLLAPSLVDPHSVLEDPWQGRAETLPTLLAAAAAGGYGTVALLPRARCWRDSAAALQLASDSPLGLHLWGSFSVGGCGEMLADPIEQFEAGAIGLAEESLPPLPLLERGLHWGALGSRPLLLAPWQASLAQRGLVREGVEALRAGWPIEPESSETLPLVQLLALAASLPEQPLAVMNVSTAGAVALLRRAPRRLPCTVGWWHLVTDCANHLAQDDQGWRLQPCLGGPPDRAALIEGLADGVISGVAVHHSALDAEECLLPLEQRPAGLAGFDLVLPLLWQELVAGRGWSPAQLWQALCWGPADLLGVERPRLAVASRQWLLFDPAARWTVPRHNSLSLAANRPLAGQAVVGKVLAAGLASGLAPGLTADGLAQLRAAGG